MNVSFNSLDYQLSIFEYVNHLGNVLATVSDRRTPHQSGIHIDYYEADVTNATLYYPFGMEMKTYQADSNGYRYGFNGAEKVNEVNGEGGSYDLGLRLYNTKLGRMFKMDPRTREYPWQSPYAYHRNNPVTIVDFLGGGDPLPTADKINALTAQSGAQRALAIEKNSQAEVKIKEAIAVVDQALALYDNYENNDDISAEDATKRDELIAKSAQLTAEGEKLYAEADAHEALADEYLGQAVGLIPVLMKEYYAEKDRLAEWKKQAKKDVVVKIIKEELGLDLLFQASMIQIFGPTLYKPPLLGSFPGTSLWSKYVAAKFPMNATTRLPIVGGTSVMRGLGRLALPVMLAWQGFKTAESIHDLYRTYEDGPTVAEIQFYLEDFEKWKKDNPE